MTTSEMLKVQTVKSGHEVRYIKTTIEYRVHAEPKAGSIGTIIGYGAVFDSLSEDLGGFRETIAHGAFDRVISENQDVRCLVDHDSGRIIGRTEAGTMRLSVDSTGLRYEIDVADTTPGRDVITSIARGDVTGSSFAFTVVENGQDWSTVDGEQRRELTDLDVWDTGPVAFPAYAATVTEASFRSLHNHLKPNLERFRTRLDTAKRYVVVSKDK